MGLREKFEKDLITKKDCFEKNFNNLICQKCGCKVKTILLGKILALDCTIDEFNFTHSLEHIFLCQDFYEEFLSWLNIPFHDPI